LQPPRYGRRLVEDWKGWIMSKKVIPEQEIALYDAIGRAIANLHAALAKVDAAWVIVTAERPSPSVGAFAALDAAEQILTVAREDLARARTALIAYTEERTEQ
jgi:hypothetical protein